MKKPICRLSGKDGNVYSVIGRVTSVLNRSGQREKAEEFTKQALSAESYDAVIKLCFDFVDVR